MPYHLQKNQGKDEGRRVSSGEEKEDGREEGNALYKYIFFPKYLLSSFPFHSHFYYFKEERGKL